MAMTARRMTVTIRELPLVLAAIYAGGLIGLYVLGWGDEESGETLDKIVQSLQNLPVNRAFHFGVFGIAFVWLASRFSSYNRIWRAFSDRRRPRFMDWQDWEVIFELRKSAFHLRTRADLLVIASLFVLFGGMYFVVFIVPKVLSQDDEIAVKSIQNQYEQDIQDIWEGRMFESIRNQYGQNIQDIWAGRRWVKLGGSSENDDQNQRYPDSLKTAQSVNFVKPVQIVMHLINLEDDDEARVETPGSEIDNGSMMGTGITHELVEFIDIGQEAMVAEFSHDGQVGVIGGMSDSVFLTRDRGKQWSKMDRLFRGAEWIDAAAFSHDGQIGVIVGDEGTVLVTDNQGEDWSQSRLGGDIGRRVTAEFSHDGQIGVIGGTSGSVFLTRDKGNQWSEVEGLFPDSEQIDAAAFSHNGQIGVTVSTRGTVLVTDNQGEDWSESRLGGDIGWGIAAELSPDGQIGVIGDNAGTVFLTRDGGEEWRLLDSVGAAGELSDMSPDIKLHINLLEDKRVQIMMYTTVPLIDSSGGIDRSAWIKAIRSIPQRGERGDRSMTGAFSNGEDVGAFGTRSGRVFLTVNRGDRWDKQDLEFKSSEWMQSAAFSEDGELAVIAGSQGTVAVARNIGSESRIRWSTVEAPWNVTDDLSMLWEEDDREEGRYNRNLYIYGETVIARIGRDYIDERNKDYYALVYFGGPDERLSISESYEEIRKHPVMRDAEIIREIDSRIVDSLSDSRNPLGRELSALLTRAIVLTILLFISQHLMRMSQYDLRLAAFWDSRANALLLFKNFARKKSRTFDRLVDSLAPDDYDFKSTRRMPRVNLDVLGRRHR